MHIKIEIGDNNKMKKYNKMSFLQKGQNLLNGCKQKSNNWMIAI